MQQDLALSDLDMFVRFVEAGSLSAAARQLGVPTSTVSRAVQRLEGALGESLVHRSSQAVVLTDVGRALFTRASPHLEGLRNIQATFHDGESQLRGVIHLTAPADVGEAFLGGLLTRFTVRYPHIQVKVNLISRMVDMVKEGYDVALRAAYQLPDHSTLVARKVAPVEVHLFASPGYLAQHGVPNEPEDLAQHECILFGATDLQDNWVLEGPGGPRILPVTGRLVSNELSFVRAALLAGAGVGPLPAYFAEDYVQRERLVRVLPEWQRPTGTIYIVYPAARHLPKKVIAFRDFVIESFRAPHKRE